MLALLGLVLLGTLLAGAPAASAFHRPTTGSKIDLLVNCDQDLSWNSKSPFFIRHGFVQPGWSDPAVVTPDVRRGYLAPWTRFMLWIDGTTVAMTFEITYDAGADSLYKLYQRNFPLGMSGVHKFTGQWFQDASLSGGTFRKPVLALECTSVITFF